MTSANRRLQRLITIFAVIGGIILCSASVRAGETGTPFMANIACTEVFLTPDACDGGYSIPADVRLVIEYVSFFCQTSSNPKWGAFYINTTGAGAAAQIAVSLPGNAGGKDSAQLGQPVKFFADANSHLGVLVALQSAHFIGQGGCYVVLTGEQVPTSS
jgi:hypothetical protein